MRVSMLSLLYFACLSFFIGHYCVGHGHSVSVSQKKKCYVTQAYQCIFHKHLTLISLSGMDGVYPAQQHTLFG